MSLTMEEMITFIGNNETGYFIIENPNPDVIDLLIYGRKVEVREESPIGLNLNNYQTLYKFCSTGVILSHRNCNVYSYFSFGPEGLSRERVRFILKNNASVEINNMTPHHVTVNKYSVYSFSHPISITVFNSDVIFSFESEEDLMEWRLSQ